MVPEGDILDIILSNPDPQQTVNRLVTLALANDGKDNITVILVHT